MTPEHTAQFISDVKWAAEARKKKGHTIAQAFADARKENKRIAELCGEALPDETVLEVVNEVYGKKARKIFIRALASFAVEKPEAIVWAVRHILLANALNLIIGDPDVGKTLVAILYIARLTQEGKKVMVVCREDSYGHVWLPRLIAAGARLDLVMPVYGCYFEDDPENLIPWMLDDTEHLQALKELLIKEGVALCIIDPLADFAGKLDLNKVHDIRTITRSLTDIAQKLGIAILTICHTTKALVDSVIKTAAGSFQLMAAVAVAWFLTNDPDEPGQRLMLMARNKYGSKKRGFKYTIEGVPYPDDWPGEQDPDGIGKVVIQGEETRTADELLERHTDKDNSEKKKIRRWVKQMLQNGPVTTAHAGEEMRARGYNVNTVTAVCIEMGVKRDGKTWELPVSKVPKQEEIFNGSIRQ